MLDGELVIRDADGNLEFDALQERIHPAQSRIELLSKEIPADYVVFDLLAEGDEALLEAPLSERRGRLEAIAEQAGLELTPLNPDAMQAERWLSSIEGVMAKQLDAPYIPGKRKGMAKVKRERTIDCVVMGWRPGKEEGTVGSLILGLYDDGELRSVGHISGFSAAAKRSMRAMLAPLETGESGTAEPSRWTGGRDLEWVALRPELVIEVGYDHAASGGFGTGRGFTVFGTTKSRVSAGSSSWTKAGRRAGPVAAGDPPPPARRVGVPPTRHPPEKPPCLSQKSEGSGSCPLRSWRHRPRRLGAAWLGTAGAASAPAFHCSSRVFSLRWLHVGAALVERLVFG